ncbi:MAG TPA: hypothetical protein VHM70_20115 [Polyangiaceae bacterium]|jgi:uncharacterized membrane protein YozB (DUF420 family)|nr:hypothetical protein [Polyangiaceae bacterium]
MIYSILLFLHSVLRWLILAFAILALVRSAQGGAYTKAHRTSSSLFVATLHTNVVIGIVNYALFSPTIRLALSDVGAAMKISALRFFLVEHSSLMLVAVVVATIGSARIKRGKDDAQKHKRTLVFYGIALALILVGIPWPFYSAGRPLVPLM